MAHLNDIDNTAPADSLKSGADTLNTWRTRIDALNDVLGDITSAEADQVEAIGTTTISATQWGYVGAFDQGLATTSSVTFAALTTAALTATANLDIGAYTFRCAGLIDDTLTSGRVVFASTNGLLADDSDMTFSDDTLTITKIAGLTSFTASGDLDIGTHEFRAETIHGDATVKAGVSDTIAGEIIIYGHATGSTAGGCVKLHTAVDHDTTYDYYQINVDEDDLIVKQGTTIRLSLAGATGAWTFAGAINFGSQNMTNVDIDSGTIGGVTLDGAIAGGDQTFTNVGNMTFAAGSILASGDTNTNTLLLKANDTTCITLTTASTDQMDLAAVYSLTAINNLDIGAYNFRAASLTADGLTATRVIFAGTNGLLSDDGDMTFVTDTLTVKKLVLNDATTASTDMLTLTPGGALAAAATWRGIYINGTALDPSGAGATIKGICVDLSGVTWGGPNEPDIAAICSYVPVGQTSMHVDEQVHVNMDISALADGQHRTGIDLVVDSVGSSGGEMHGYDIATVGAGSATIVGYATHGAIAPIHQHIGTFAAADKCWEYDDSETSYADVTTAFGSAGTDVAIFDDDDDAIFIGDAAVFSEIEVILATAASVDLKLTFWFSLASGWTQFYPSDDTNGFTQDGAIRYESDGLTNWAAQSVSGSSQYYIKIIRTKNTVVTSPTEDTIKILDPTLYSWDKTGALNVLSMAVPTITTVTTLTAGGNLDIGSYTLTAGGLIDDTLTSGRVVFVTTGGQLADDTDFLFATDTLTVTKIGAFEATGAINFATQAMTNVDINSGTVDGCDVTVGSTKTLDVSAGTLTLAAAQVTATYGGTGQNTSSASGVPKLSTGTWSIDATQDDLGDGSTYKQYNPASVAITGGTVGGITLNGAIAGGDQAFTGVGDMTFTDGSILAAASANTNTLLVKAGGLAGTSVITITSLDAGDTIAFANVTGLVATGPLDIGAQGFRANTLTADGLTATRVVFAGTAGLLSDSSVFTFVTDTLTVTKLGAFEATGAINFGNQAMTNVDINSGTINGITDLAVADGGTGASTAPNARTALGLVIGTNVLAQQTIGIADDNLMEVDDADAADDDYAKFTAAGLEGRSYAEAVSDLSVDTRRLENLCRNAAFASRSEDTSHKPDEWTLEGTPTVAYDTVDTTYGDHAVKLTASGAGDEGINQTLTHLKISTNYQVFARVKVDSGDTASLITTGATTNINADSTSASWEDITGEFTTDASGTDVVIKLVASADTDVAYFCGITCVEGDIAPGNFIRRVNEAIFLTNWMTDTDWNYTAKSDDDSGILDLSGFGNGCPPKIKAVFINGEGRDVASAGAGIWDCYWSIGRITGEPFMIGYLQGVKNDWSRSIAGRWCPCDSNGDVYVNMNATGADTMDIALRVHGYILG